MKQLCDVEHPAYQSFLQEVPLRTVVMGAEQQPSALFGSRLIDSFGRGLKKYIRLFKLLFYLFLVVRIIYIICNSKET